MTNMSDYFEIMNKLDTCIKNKKVNEAKECLKELYQFKPVRLSYYNRQARVMLIEKKYAEIYQMLDGKIVPYYLYPFLTDIYDIFQSIALLQNDELEIKRCTKSCEHIDKEDYGDDYAQIELEKQIIHSSLENIPFNLMKELLERYYIEENFVLYCVLRGVLDYDHLQKGMKYKEWIYDFENYGYLKEKLECGKGMCLVLGDEDDTTAKLLCIFLEKQGFSVVRASLQDLNVIKVVTESNNGIVFARQNDMDIASSLHPTCQRIRRLSIVKKRTNEWSFGWFGDYADYISQVFLEDCQTLIAKEPSIRFSVVIPARNSAETLQYTLKTVLEQEFEGEYEVIVSDNSVADNYEVEDLCCRLEDPHIVYLKTPRELPLTKSFEYAYLHTRGEYVIGLGSDDGLLPWTLDKLDQVTGCFPDEEIIAWIRGFYAWPGFNDGQENQFVIPGQPTDGMELPVGYESTKELLYGVLSDAKKLYTLPMLYINSCFKRSYLKTLLEKTGCLWDGICQDVYMGVVNCCINERILHIYYPLTIAGMSNGSAGALSNRGIISETDQTNEQQRILHDGNIGIYCRSAEECFTPYITTDVGLLFINVMRAVRLNILSKEDIEKTISWKDVFKAISRQIDIRDTEFDRKIHEMRYSAMQHGDRFLKWFDENIYEPALVPRVIQEDEDYQKIKYTEDFTIQNGGILDASKYGVNNIYDAARLFTIIMRTGKVERLET